MRNYEPPEAVEIGPACASILGQKGGPYGDDVMGPDFPIIRDSPIDSD